MEKKCFKCEKAKDLSEFYVHKKMKDGHLNKCKECAKIDAHAHREKNIDAVRAYDRFRAKSTKRKQTLIQNSRKWRSENPDGWAAHILLNNAVRDGRIKKGPCEVCGSVQRIHGHHGDYTKPLDVNWLCSVHHAAMLKRR